MSDIRNVIIIGSGPAGFTAAIYAARANLKPLLFEGMTRGGQPGGQLMLTSDVENYPGFPKGIMGPEMMQLFREQAARFGTELVVDDVTAVDFSKSPFKVVSGGQDHYARTVIISTGASANWLNIPSEKALQGYGVSACATCDGFFFKGKDVAVIGGGDSAMEEATFLTRFANSVTLVHRRDEFRASKIMLHRAQSNPKVTFVPNVAVLDVLGEAAVSGLRVRSNATGQERELPVQGVFLAIGHTPATAVFKAAGIETDEKGYVVVRENTRTNVEGVFVAGDVNDPRYRQAVSAAGMGCMAALDAERWLEAQA